MMSDDEESNTSTVMSTEQVNPPVNSEIYLLTPLMVLNLTSHSGDTNFRVMVPRSYGRDKWNFSTKLNKLYAGRNISFPVKIFFPPGRKMSVVVCPVYEASNLRLCPVRRCINCSISDSSILEDHLIRVDGSDGIYLMHKDRSVVEIPLRIQSLDENSMTLLIRMTCRTSCVGGPNRNLFALLFTLVDETRRQVATDVLHVKCCESPFRDLKNELKLMSQGVIGHVQAITENDQQQISQITSSMAPKTRKRKLGIKSTEETVSLKIPKIFEKKVKKYVNRLYVYGLEEPGRPNRYFSNTDTE